MPTPEYEEYRKHWEAVEGGFRLREIHGQNVHTRIVVSRGQVQMQCDHPEPVSDRESVRFLAARLWEAVAIADLQLAGLIP